MRSFQKGAPNQPHDLDCYRFLPRRYTFERTYCLPGNSAAPPPQHARHARFRLQRAVHSKNRIGAAMRTCDGHGTCTRSHRPHQLLRGIQPSSGRFFTIVAEPYPRKLCRRLVEAYAAAIAVIGEDHIFHDLIDGSCDSQRNNKLYDPYGPCRNGSRAFCCFIQCV